MAQKAVEYLIAHKMVNMVGSDTHGIRHLPVLEHALHSKNYELVCELPLLNNTL
jgi:kynurenine formamidase